MQVVSEDFFDLIKKETVDVAQALQLIKDNNIADWGSDVSLYRVIL
jgi:hypothetical protein